MVESKHFLQELGHYSQSPQWIYGGKTNRNNVKVLKHLTKWLSN